MMCNLSQPVMISMITMMIFTVARSSGQQLRNPSFEDTPQDATMPQGWHACEEGTTPDILPGSWGVTNRPYHRRTYVGIITRPDGSREAIGQRMTSALEAKACYQLDMAISHSPTYADYDDHIKFRVYLGMDRCEQGQLIYEGHTPETNRWQELSTTFTTERAWRYLRIEAVHPDGRSSSEGNILIDHIRGPRPCART